MQVVHLPLVLSTQAWRHPWEWNKGLSGPPPHHLFWKPERPELGQQESLAMAQGRCDSPGQLQIQAYVAGECWGA